MGSQAGYQILKPFGMSPNSKTGQLDINLRLEQQDEEYLHLEIKETWIQILFLMINGSISRKIIGLNHIPMISTFDAQVEIVLWVFYNYHCIQDSVFKSESRYFVDKRYFYFHIKKSSWKLKKYLEFPVWNSTCKMIILG